MGRIRSLCPGGMEVSGEHHRHHQRRLHHRCPHHPLDSARSPSAATPTPCPTASASLTPLTPPHPTVQISPLSAALRQATASAAPPTPTTTASQVQWDSLR